MKAAFVNDCTINILDMNAIKSPLRGCGSHICFASSYGFLPSVYISNKMKVPE